MVVLVLWVLAAAASLPVSQVLTLSCTNTGASVSLTVLSSAAQAAQRVKPLPVSLSERLSAVRPLAS